MRSRIRRPHRGRTEALSRFHRGSVQATRRSWRSSKATWGRNDRNPPDPGDSRIPHVAPLREGSAHNFACSPCSFLFSAHNDMGIIFEEHSRLVYHAEKHYSPRERARRASSTTQSSTSLGSKKQEYHKGTGVHKNWVVQVELGQRSLQL